MKDSIGRKVFHAINFLVIATACLTCILPFIHLAAISLSESQYVSAGQVRFWPMGLTLSSYKFVLSSKSFITAMRVTLQRVLLGVPVNLLFTVLAAYPLSKDKDSFRYRNIYAWFFVFAMMFSGGLIPWYLTIKNLGMLDTIWALVIPGALPIFSMIVILNFFRGLPKELEEAALIDGAGHWAILFKIYVPLSTPSLATIALFSIVGHWNSWFDGLILMNRPTNYPLQSYLQTVIINPEAFFQQTSGTPDVKSLLQAVNNRTSKAAQLFVGMLPVLMVYPFLQKYFTKGLVLGSVKG